MSSADAFNFDQSKVLLFGKELTLSHKISTSTEPSTLLLKTLWERTKYYRSSAFPLLTIFSTLSKSRAA